MSSNIIKQIICVLSVIVSIPLYAQNDIKYNINWEKEPSLHILDSAQLKYSAVYIQDYRYVDFVTDYYLNTFYTVHNIIKVNDEIGLQLFKEINMTPKGNLVRLKVRVISPNGTVKEYKLEDLKVVYDANTGYQKFALEGIEKGCEIEYIYAYKNGVITNSREYFQNKLPINKMRFELTPHNRLSYLIKTYNGLGSAKLSEGKVVIVDSNIDVYFNERISTRLSERKRIDYKLKKYPNIDNYFTWESISNRKLDFFKQSSGKKKVSQFLEQLNLDSLSLEEKLYKIEEVIKETITIKRSSHNVDRNLGMVLKEKLADPSEIISLYFKCFEILDLELNLMFACQKNSAEIDMYFPHEMDVDEPVFYFPEINKYICPFHKYMRLGFPYYEISGSMALNIKLNLAPLSNGYYYEDYEFRKLPLYSSDVNKVTTFNYVQLQENSKVLKIKHKGIYTGYKAFVLRYMYNELEIDTANSVISGLEALEVDKFTLSNGEMIHSKNPVMPVKINASLKTEELVNYTGNTMFLKVGKLIGKQVSLHDSKERLHDVVLDYPFKNNYSIVVYLPENYNCINLDAIPNKIEVMQEDQRVMFFESAYELKGNQLIITMKENYNAFKFSKNYYEDYANVMNSAYNFSQLELIFEKNN